MAMVDQSNNAKHSRFSQMHKIGMIRIIANFVFCIFCCFLLQLYNDNILVKYVTNNLRTRVKGAKNSGEGRLFDSANVCSEAFHEKMALLPLLYSHVFAVFIFISTILDLC